jgi:hypothetical protein
MVLGHDINNIAHASTSNWTETTGYIYALVNTSGTDSWIMSLTQTSSTV